MKNSKILVSTGFLILALYLAWSFLHPPRLDVPVVALIANPDKYHGLLIRTWGYCNWNGEQGYLVTNQEEILSAISDNAIPLYLEEDPKETELSWEAAFVRIKGRFSTIDKGEWGMYAGSIGEISEFTCIEKSANPIWRQTSVGKIETNKHETSQWHPGPIWQSHGANGFSNAICAVKRSSNDFVLAGGVENPSTGMKDGWLLFFDRDGEKQFEKRFGGDLDDEFFSIACRPDGASVVAGYTTSDKQRGEDGWILGVDEYGRKDWDLVTGGPGRDVFFSVVPCRDSAWFIAGTKSFDRGFSKAGWVVKIDSDGKTMWERAYGEHGQSNFKSVVAAKSGYLVAGESKGLEGSHFGLWIMMLDSNGHIIWERRMEGGKDRVLRSVTKTQDDGFIVAAFEAGGVNSAKGSDLLMRLDSKGEVMWRYEQPSDILNCLNGTVEISNQEILAFGSANQEPEIESDAMILVLDRNGRQKRAFAYGTMASESVHLALAPDADTLILVGAHKPDVDSNQGILVFDLVSK